MHLLNRAFAVPIMMVTFATVTCAQTASTPSPEALARGYLRALTTDDLREFWSHALTYAFETASATSSLPKSMWTAKVEAIQQAWRKRIADDRSSGEVYTGSNKCWSVFRPGATFEFLETRREPGSEAVSRWKSFVKIKYSPEQNALTVRTGRTLRRLREATVVVLLATEPKQRRTLVLDDCETVSETIVLWPVPDLPRDRALELAKNATASGRPQVAIETRVSLPVPSQELFSDRPVRIVEQLKTVLLSNGVRVAPEDRQTLNLAVPADWNRFEFAEGVYTLSESERADLIEFVAEGEEARVATLRWTYSGCSPICALVRNLQPLVPNGAGGWTEGGQSFTPFVFKNLPRGQWPTELTRRVSFIWHAQNGWQVSAVQ